MKKPRALPRGAVRRARTLRRQMTRQEVRLWLQLRMLRSEGLHFRRQVPQGSYVLDFACMSARLAIELDGSQHGGVRLASDRRRDAILDGQGFRVLRFWNTEVDQN